LDAAIPSPHTGILIVTLARLTDPAALPPAETIRRRAWAVTATVGAVFVGLFAFDTMVASANEPVLPAPVVEAAGLPAAAEDEARSADAGSDGRDPAADTADAAAAGDPAPATDPPAPEDAAAPAPAEPPTASSAESAPAGASGSRASAVWQALAECESRGTWTITNGSYGGGLQIHVTTWREMGGTEFAARPEWATAAQQVVVAERIRAAHGGSYEAWPGCRAELGLP
jgi:hypothetical protein